jgi:hypothetical protein
MEHNLESELTLDTQWIEEFDKYSEFYQENVENIKLVFFYVNHNNKIVDIKQNTHLIHNNILKKEELLYLIKHNIRNNSIKYHLLSILQYNIDLDPREIIETTSISEPFLTSYSSIEDITWKPTINLLQDMNALYIIFYEQKPRSTQSHTKKIRLTNAAGISTRSTRKRRP